MTPYSLSLTPEAPGPNLQDLATALLHDVSTHTDITTQATYPTPIVANAFKNW